MEMELSPLAMVSAIPGKPWSLWDNLQPLASVW